jgi:hypothetical protein
MGINNACRAMANPEQSDEVTQQRVGRYIATYPDQGLYFHPKRDNERLLTYCYVDSGVRVKSISGVAAFLGEPDYKDHINDSAAVIAFVKGEHLTVESTMDAEILAIERGVRTCLWIEDYREELGYPQFEPSIIFTDSATAIRFLQDEGKIPNRQTRHIRRKAESVKQHLRSKRCVLKYVPSAKNCADLLTKGLGRILHERHALSLMGRPF